MSEQKQESKSIFATLSDLQTTTSVPGHGKNVAHTLPRSLFPTDTIFESAELLLAWTEENGFTHALLQKGIQKGLIDARATFKSCKKADTWTTEYGQTNVDAMEWKVTVRPNSGGTKKVADARYNDAMNSINEMLENDIPLELARKMVTKTYGEEIVSGIFEAMANLTASNEESETEES